MNPFRSGRMLQSLDELNRTLLVSGIVAMLLKMFFQQGTLPRTLLTALSFLALLCLLLRLFSKDPVRVQTQNHKFVAAVTAAKDFFRNTFGKKTAFGGAAGGREKTRKKRPTLQELRKYKYFVCPQCAQRLRVPRGKGRLRVTCTRCGNRFEIKS